MKKAISVILALVIAFSASLCVFAEGEKCDCDVTPVIYIGGFGCPIYSDPDGENEVRIFTPDTSLIVSSLPEIFLGVVGLLSGNSKMFAKWAMKAADKLIGDLRLTADGEIIDGVGIRPIDMPEEDTHECENYEFLGNARNDAETGEFRFDYDWRIDPFCNVQYLHEYVECVKELTGHDKVSFACHSQGNTLMVTYLSAYGSEDIDKLCFLSPAYKGLSLVGYLFTGEISVEGKKDELTAFVDSMLGSDSAVTKIIGILNATHLTDFILKKLEKVLDEQYENVYENFLVPVFGTMPGIWSFVPDEFYEDAKTAAFKGDSKYDKLIEKIDNYHYNVQSNVEELLQTASDNGTGIIICAGYGIPTIPIVSAPAAESDFLIDTCYMGIGATCAPYGSTLGDGYSQKVPGEKNYISPDNKIDASTCAFPEWTWFIMNQDHNTFTHGYLDLLNWAITFDGQPTVFSDSRFPQFTVNSADGEKLVPVTAG